MFLVNLAQALKFSGDEESSRARLDSVDRSACGLNFKLCVAVLRNDLIGACDLMEQIGADGSIDEKDYVEWPVFREFRQQECFQTTFEKVFGKPPLFEDTHKFEEDGVPPTIENDSDSASAT